MNHSLQLATHLANICAQMGVQHIIISPGSRSAPLTAAFARHPEIHTRVVVDERSAGFIALGMAQQMGQPVGLVCTSGSAPFNYGPAVAEAYYQHIPLLLFTADRPPEWLDQQDNQTTHQQDYHAGHTRLSVQLPVDYHHPDAVWHSERIICQAINTSQWPHPGPVQLNIPFREPLYPPVSLETPAPKIIQHTPVENQLSPAVWQSLLNEWYQANQRLIIAGMLPPLADLRSTLSQLSTQSAIAADITANLHQADGVLHHADVALPDETLVPDLLITLGGPITSKHLKLFLRKYQPQTHWHIDPLGQYHDTYQSLTRIIPVKPTYFFNALARHALPAEPSHFATIWRTKVEATQQMLHQYLNANQPFNEFSAIYQVLQALPSQSRLQLGNSMPVRYVDMIGLGQCEIVVNANRGTSGIDGSVSTAVGAAITTTQITTLIVGDLSFFYDRNGLWHDHVPANLRIVVLNNQGGGIFGLINGPDQLSAEERVTYFETPHTLTAKGVAAEFKCGYRFCNSNEGLQSALVDFFAPHQSAMILEIHTERTVNAEVFRQVKELQRDH